MSIDVIFKNAGTADRIEKWESLEHELPAEGDLVLLGTEQRCWRVIRRVWSSNVLVHVMATAI